MPVKPSHPLFRHTVILVLAFVAALALTSAAVASAYSTLAQRFPSLFVDPYGAYSLVQLQTWGMPRSDIRLAPSYRIAEADGRPLEARRPSQTLEALRLRIKEIPETRGEVQLRFEGPEGRSLITQPLVPLGLDEILFFFVIYALVAWVVLWSGGLVFVLCGRPAAGRAYLAWSVISFVFLLTFYDYHTRTSLAPLFSASTVGLPVSALWLAYSFPEPPLVTRGWVRRALVALTTATVAAALWLISDYVIGGDSDIVRRIADVVLVPCIAALALSVIVRVRRSTGRSRAELITAIWGLVLMPLLIASINVVRLLTGVDSLHLVLPFIILLFPLSIVYALIRNNILATSAVLTPRMLMVPLALSVLILALLGGYAAHWALQHRGGALSLPIFIGIGCFVVLLVLGRRAAIRLFFPATLQFRPTIKLFTDQLATLRDSADVKQAVLSVVARWLPTMEVRILPPESLSSVAHLPPDCLERLGCGERVWTFEPPWNRHLLVPMRSLGEVRGVLCVGPKRGAALYTQEDLDLLETVAGLGALALHHARTLEELERLRSFEVEVLRGEKQQALGALSAEICHEVVYPLNFIRDLLKQAARDVPIKAEDIEIGKEEIGRLERMISSLRMLDPPTPRLEPITAAFPIERAAHLLRDLIRQKGIAVSIVLPPDLRLVAQPDLAVQLFVNLLRNAAQAVEDGGAIGVRSFERQGDRLIEVWDTGQGIPESVRDALFSRRVTTKDGGQGIGLAVAYRIARNFRWELSFEREEDRTCFRVVIPATRFSHAPESHEGLDRR